MAKTQREIFDENDNIASVSGDTLSKLNIQNSQGLNQVFSGLYITNAGGSAYPSITYRGLHTSYYYSPSVRLYVDGVPQDMFFINQELLDVENVEIFKGYGGSVYGENAQAGVISINSNIMTNTPKGNINLSYGNLDRSIIASTSGALIKDRLYGKISFKRADFLGQVKDIADNKRADTATSNLLRASLLYNQGVFFVGFDYYLDKTTTHDFFYLSDSELQDKSNITKDFGTNGVPSLKRTIHTYALKMGANVENLEVQNVLSVQNRQMPITNFGSLWEENQLQVNDELRFKQYYENDSSSLYGAYFGFNNFKHHFVRDTTRSGDNNTLKKYTFALFTDHKIILPHNFELSVGARYQYNHSDIDYIKGVNSTNSVNSFINALNEHNYALRAAISYKIYSDHKLYLSASKGFKQGGFPNAIFSQSYSNAFKPEHTYTAELGYKGFFLDDKLYINADYFFTYTHNQQWNVLIEPTPGATPQSAIGNLGNQYSHGLEFEGKYQYLSDSFAMLNFALLDARYAKGTRVVSSGLDLSGKQAQFVPRISINASIDSILWRNSVANLYFNAAISHNSRIYFSESHVFSQKPYTLVNIGLRAEFNKHLAFSINAMNVFNTLYDTYGYYFASTGAQHQIGKLRSISATLSAKF